MAAFTVYSLAGAVAFRVSVTGLGLHAGDWQFALLVVALYGAMHLLGFTIVAVQVRMIDRGAGLRHSARDTLLPTLPLESIAATLVGLVTIGHGEMGVAAVAGMLPFMLVGSYLLRELVKSRERAAQVAQLADGRRRLIAKAFNAEDRARRDLAQALHDNTIQVLLAAQQEINAAADGDDEALTRADASVRSAVAQLRATTFDLHPAVLRHAGLAAALPTLARHHAASAGFDASVDVEADGGLPDGAVQLVFAMAQELLANAAKHSGASHVRVRVRRQDGSVQLEVADDGRGFEPSTRADAVVAGHIGLASVAERAEEAGGIFMLESTPDGGTRVLIDLPLNGVRCQLSRPRRSASATAAARSETSSFL